MINEVYKLKSSPLIEIAHGEEANMDIALEKEKVSEPAIKICITTVINFEQIIPDFYIKRLTIKHCIFKKLKKRSKRNSNLIRIQRRLLELSLNLSRFNN